MQLGGVHILRIQDGKIAEHWGNDDLGHMRQPGSLPAWSPRRRHRAGLFVGEAYSHPGRHASRADVFCAGVGSRQAANGIP